MRASSRERVLVSGLMLVVSVAASAAPAGAQRETRAQRRTPADSLAVWYALGLNAHHLCAGLWVVGRDLERTAEEVIAQDIEPFPAFRWEDDFRYAVDEATHTATATDSATGSRSARYTGDQGCTILTTGAADVYFQPQDVVAESARDTVREWPTGDRNAFAPAGGDEARALSAILDWAFDDAALARPQNTRGIVVIHDGRIIAERYAPGWGPYTPQLSWSMGKSIAATLIGVLVQEGAVEVDDPAPIAEWQGKRDPRRSIRIADLLRMSSGLDFDNLGLSPATSYIAANEHFRPYFDALNVSSHAVNQPPRFEPGEVWRYRNSDPLALMTVARRMWRRAVRTS